MRRRALAGFGEERAELGERRALMASERQNMIRTGFPDFLGDVFLAVQGRGGDEAAGQFQRAQQLWHDGDLVALVPDLALARPQTALRGPRADNDAGSSP